MSKILIILGLIFLVGCGSTVTAELETTTGTNVIEHPSKPRPVVMKEVEWRVLNRERLEQLLETESEIGLFALNGEGYENLASNVNELKRYIQQQDSILDFYISLTDNVDQRLQSNNEDD